MTLVDQPLGRLGLQAEQRANLDIQPAPESLGGLQHGGRVAVGARHGLLAIHILARLEGGDGEGVVLVVVDADVHRVDVVASQEILEVGVGVGDAEVLLRRFQLLGEEVRHRHHFRVLDPGVGVQMVGADLADADDADPNLVAHGRAPWGRGEGWNGGPMESRKRNIEHRTPSVQCQTTKCWLIRHVRTWTGRVTVL